MERRILCLDIGGTSIKHALCDERGQMLEIGKVAIGEDLDTFLEQIRSVYEKTGDVDGIACSFPGEVHSQEGVIYGISALPYIHECPIKEMISQRCDSKKVTLLNDANAAALGEAWLGVGKDYKNIAFVIVGSGVGGAVIENGELYPGTTMNKAEIGNFPMGGIEDGELLCWSSFTLDKEAKKYSKKHQSTIDGKGLMRLAEDGDPEAAACVDEFYHYMAVGCVCVQFAYDPEIIAIGGGISENAAIMEGILNAYKELVKGQQQEYLKPTILACKRGNDANLLGTLAFYLRSEA